MYEYSSDHKEKLSCLDLSYRQNTNHREEEDTSLNHSEFSSLASAQDRRKSVVRHLALRSSSMSRSLLRTDRRESSIGALFVLAFSDTFLTL